jgi:hypothetical protein
VAQLSQIIADSLGRQVQLIFQLSEDEPNGSRESVRPLSTRQRMQQVCQRPYVRQAIELFDATPLRLEEMPGSA